MEFELKYKIDKEEVAQSIWKDTYIMSLEEEGSRKENHFKATYFDTKDCDLLNKGIAFRIREEGSKINATVKWEGNSKGAVHIRQEFNISLDKATDCPDQDLFKGSEIEDMLSQAMGGKKLIPMLETDFLRKSLRLEIGGTLVEVSVDQGLVKADGKSAPIMELELELFRGPEEPLLRLGEELMGKYNLEPETESKFARGLMISGKK